MKAYIRQTVTTLSEERGIYDVDLVLRTDTMDAGVKSKRAKKKQRNNPQKQKLNDNASRIHFSRLVEHNFEAGDYFTAVTFPPAMPNEERKRRFNNYLQRLAYLYRKHDLTWKAMYVREYGEENGMLHFHLLLPSYGKITYAEIIAVWAKDKALSANCCNIDEIGLDDDNLAAISWYMSKERNNEWRETIDPNERVWERVGDIKEPPQTIIGTPDDATVSEDTNPLKQAKSLKDMDEIQTAKANDELKAVLRKMYSGYDVEVSYDAVGKSEGYDIPYAHFRLTDKSKKSADHEKISDMVSVTDVLLNETNNSGVYHKPEPNWFANSETTETDFREMYALNEYGDSLPSTGVELITALRHIFNFEEMPRTDVVETNVNSGKVDYFRCKDGECDKCARQSSCDKHGRCEYCFGYDTSFCNGCIFDSE